MSAEKKLENEQIPSLQKSLKVEEQRTVRQRFFNQRSRSFSFFAAAHNDRGYGHWRLAGAKLSPSDKVNAGANAAKRTSTSQ